MTNKVEFPIRAKLLLLISGLILAATGAYLALAVHLFQDDKTTLVYELNINTVRTLAAETEAYLGKIADKMKLLTQGHREEAWIRTVLEAEPDLIAYTLYEPDGAGWKPSASVRNPDYLKLYGLGTSEVDRIHDQIPIPFAKILAKRSWVMNSTLPGGAPILTLALVIDITDGARVAERVAVADVRLDKILKLLSGRGIATAYVVDAEGQVIAHPDMNLVSTHASLSEVPIVREAADSQVASQIKSFNWKGREWLGAYASVGLGGLQVVSQVEQKEAFRAAQKLIEKSVLFALLVITVGLLISGRVARGFTEPLSKLLAATEKLARWEFGDSIHVNSRDEVAKLARAFNAMAADIQNQRAQLESSKSELEIKVKERTEALEGQKKHLAEAQDALLRTTRLASLGELAGAAAHEVLNPINNLSIRLQRMQLNLSETENQDIKLMTEILGAWKKSFDLGGWVNLESELKKPSQDGVKTLGQEDLENLDAISKDVQKRLVDRKEDFEFFSKEIIRVTRIINNMRTLSRVGGERKPIDIHVPIDDTALTLADLFDKRKVALVKDFSSDARDRFTVVGDKDELVQVFSNLLRNAFHAISSAKRRAPAIRITTKRNGERVEVRISDNGTGIKAEHLARIFEPDFTTKSVEEGTGLGLSISRRLVRAFGGDLEVEQTIDGEGTTFLIWFPATS